MAGWFEEHKREVQEQALDQSMFQKKHCSMCHRTIQNPESYHCDMEDCLLGLFENRIKKEKRKKEN